MNGIHGWRDDGRCRAKADLLLGDVKLFVFTRERNGDTAAARVSWTRVPEGGELPVTLSITKDQACRLMDDLWDAGIRPSEAASPQATVQHIADLRAVAFKLLGITHQ